MSSHACRLCDQALPAQPLLQFRNMPGAAQHFPDRAQLSHESGIDLDIFQCASCGLVQTAHEPVPYYREVIRAAAFSEEMKSFRRQQFADFVQRYDLHGKRLLEVGCGRGEYLTLFAEAGVEAHGLEYDTAAVETCLAQGLRAKHGFIEQPRQTLTAAPFDVFATLNFLEHWPEPRASLRGIAHNLGDDGIGLVEVPNFDMILRQKLFTEFISDHICYFTRDTLTTLLQISGFEIVTCEAVWHDYILSAVVRKRRSCDVTGFSAARENLQQALNDYTRQHAAQGVAIWGAGHQALATIALLELADRVRYVVDSAPFKQDKFTPATHLPIVAPDHLDRKPVGAIIIMAASYSDEVARTIRQRWGDTFHLAILREHGLEILPHGA
ncbi:MAG: class I SAM-dependent methyltransferase [Gammaproteobacteria bacterium]|nr:class I SAM-dependent methyltransferase [Sideroxydans sp.]MBU3904453.1 class I SAM-dependent methyltransferase [Gammaproteobacteria bacterium]MBU4046436.1 class I SAM-dependent methyltransferase [Gammaproteobacteria bacterium]MBU4150843.1 class I SAM-dependent methyltransferase [Gammaproteobacteria bacterium]